MNKLSSLLLIVLVFGLVSLSAAQESSNEVSEKWLSDAVGGYSIKSPADLNRTPSDEGFAFVNTAKTILIVVKRHNYNNFQAFSNDANLERDGLTLVGKVQNLNDSDRTFRTSKQTANGLLIADTFVTFSPYGGGTLIVAFSERDNAEAAFEKGLQMARSVDYVKREAPPAETPSRQQPSGGVDNSEAASYFKGKHLLYLYTNNGYSERRDIYLCSSGTFYTRSDMSSISQNGTGAVAGGADGYWTASANGGLKLILRFQNGNVREYNVTKNTQGAGGILLNGARYFVENQNVCR